MSYSEDFLKLSADITSRLDVTVLEKMVTALFDLRERGGRLFVLGVGGSAANASHAVNDFRKIANIETYTPTDNAAELTARVNDDGWDSCFANWLKVSRFSKNDMLMIFSVGGGDKKRNVSPNLIVAMDMAKSLGAPILSVVGRDGGYAAQVSTHCVVIPPLNAEMVTPQTEGFQAIVWHLLVSHPKLKSAPMKWESITK